jgi:hypothetical protein
MTTDQTRKLASELERALTDPALADRVEMVVRPLGDETYRAASVDGSVTFRRTADGGCYRYDVVEVQGRDPLGDQSDDRFVGHALERDARFPNRRENAYPHAFDSIAQFFDAPCAPDLVATHTAAHHVDGHHGQHGSLAAVQARAPFIAAGAGIRSMGMVDRSTRSVNVAPTIAALLGLDPHPDAVGPTGEPRPGAFLRRQDGDPETALLDGTVADHVVVFLLDGCNANLLHDAIDVGEAPNVAALLARGTGYRFGSFASLPTATLANHTTAVTGAHPGHSGVLHNTWYDRERDELPNLLDLRHMFWCMKHLSPDVETVFQALARSRPGAFSSTSFEFCDTGASDSLFAQVRGGRGLDLPDLDAVTHAEVDHARASATYELGTKVDHVALQHSLDAWAQVHGNPLPALTWCGFVLTDEAGHASGPHGEAARAAVRESDARIGEVVAAVERAGVLERTAFLVIADHGMEQSDPEVSETWDEHLRASGVPHREVGGGLIYVG